MEIKKVIVIGASAGGIGAVIQLISRIPPNLPAAFFIVVHLSKNSSPEIILNQIQKQTNYCCEIPEHDQDIKAGYIYLAAPDIHLIVKKGSLRLIKGPHENYWRPSIDVLFRSAAAAYDSHVIGIILTGMLDDGTSGMLAIKSSGGVCIVQEPLEAEFSDMPVNVLNRVDVDYQVSIPDIRYILDDLFSKPQTAELAIPENIKIEAEITERMASHIELLGSIADRSDFSCPDCGGALWKIKNEQPPRYRCYTGHVMTERMLLQKQGEGMEESLWISIRMMEERRNMLLKIAAEVPENESVTINYREKANELDTHIERLKQLLLLIT